MKARLFFLLKFLIVIVSLYVVQKPIFMLCNTLGFTAGDYVDVILYGLSLDISTACYILILPLLLTLVSIWTDKLKIRAFLLPYYILIALVSGAIFIADTALYDFWQFKLDAGIFFYLKTPKDAFQSVSGLYIFSHILLVLIYAVIESFLLYVITPKHFERAKYRIKASTLGVLLCVAVVFIIRGGFGMSTTNVGQVYFSDNQKLNQSAVNPAFSLLSSMGKTDDFAAEYNFLEESECKRLFDALYPESELADDVLSDTILNNKRPNVLIIIMEGFGANFIANLGGMSGVTPNFDQLINEGVIFTKCYGNSFRTDRGMVSALSGYLGLPNTSIMKMPTKSRTLPSVALSLSKEGYTTSFLYGGDINFTNMLGYLRGVGYHKVVSDKDFTLKERTTNAWGVNDDITFDYLYNDIVSRDKNKPWMTTFLTLSSHEPFIVPYHRLKEPVPNSMAYTDDCIGKFISKLKKSPEWNNLLIACVADHGSYYPVSGVRGEPRFFKIPFLLLGGAVSGHKVFDMPVNQSDLAATILAQMNLPHSDYRFSRNVLSQKYKENPFACYTYFNGFGFVDNTGITVFDNDGMRKVLDEGKTGISSDLRIEKGQSIIQTIYDDLGAR